MVAGDMTWTAKDTPWCREHWEDVPHTLRSTQLLVTAFIDRLAEDGMVPAAPAPGWLQSAREQHYPLCCFIGEQAMERLIRQVACES
jgi:hypothetical protein